MEKWVPAECDQTYKHYQACAYLVYLHYSPSLGQLFRHTRVDGEESVDLYSSYSPNKSQQPITSVLDPTHQSHQEKNMVSQVCQV